jgi:hypothetical protein
MISAVALDLPLSLIDLQIKLEIFTYISWLTQFAIRRPLDEGTVQVYSAATLPQTGGKDVWSHTIRLAEGDVSSGYAGVDAAGPGAWRGAGQG